MTAARLPVRFAAVDPAVQSGRCVADDDVVAWFTLPSGERAGVTLERLHPFHDDVWLSAEVALAGPHAAAIVRALAEPVRSAPLAGGTPERLDLSHRFAVSDAADTVPWTWLGFTSLQTADTKLVSHVLGVTENDPARSQALFSHLLGEPIDAEPWLRGLDARGCTAWREGEVRYWPLPLAARVRCLEWLAPLRERFLELVRDAVRDARLATPRHAHFTGGPRGARLALLDSRGLFVEARSDGPTYAGASAYPLNGVRPDSVPPQVVHQRCLKILKERAEWPGAFSLHTLTSWGIRWTTRRPR